MSHTGRSLRIYLASGEVTGIRHAELVNWTGQALACPRSRLDELDAWDEAKRCGIYLLVGAETAGDREVYIGESENVLKRVRQHIGQKDFWQEVVLFTSKDENLTKAHIRYLEHRLMHKAREAGRYKVLNGNEASSSTLPRSDRAAMEQFMENIEILIGALGHRVFVPLTALPKGAATVSERYSYIIAGATAYGAPTDEGFVIFKGSTARSLTRESMGPGNVALKQALQTQGKLLGTGDFLQFTEDVLFGTPSQAGSVVAGTSCNGWVSWKRENGRTLKEVEVAAAQPAGSSRVSEG